MDGTDKKNIDISFEDDWMLKNRSYNKDTEHVIESLFAQGNGYLVSRAITEEAETNKVNYSGNYIVGLYNKAVHNIGEKKLERDEIVNLPNWWQVVFKINNNSWTDINRSDIQEFERTLYLKNGMLEKSMLLKDKIGNLTRVSSKRAISFSNRHVFAQTYSIQPLNYKGKISIKTLINGNVYNERDIKAKHLYISEKEGSQNIVCIAAETLKSNNMVFILNQFRTMVDGTEQKSDFNYLDKDREISGEFEVELKENQILTLEKKGYIKNFGLLYNFKHVKEDALALLDTYKDFDDIVAQSSAAWDAIWKKGGLYIKAEDKIQPYVNFYLYHLFITYSAHTETSNSGIPAYSIQMEKNHGLAGWEEMFVLPYLIGHFPEVARRAIGYRTQRLQNAIDNAGIHKFKGALFPWKSGINGKEQSFRERFDIIQGKWMEDLGYLQRHINVSVAHNIIQYFKATNDTGFLYLEGIETLCEICRFWADTVEFDREKHRYNINGVIGPDEFHPKYETALKPGINNNAYTNFMVIWVLGNTVQWVNQMPGNERGKLSEKIGLKPEELQKWRDISMFTKIEISDDEIIEQFSGYFKLAQMDWSEYKRKYPDLHRIDRILQAEGKKTSSYQISQQADALLPFYFLRPYEIREIMLETGYLLEEGFLSPNFEYYFYRTSHTSLLSKPIHAMIAHRNGDFALSYQLFYETLSEVEHFKSNNIIENGLNMGIVGALMNMIVNVFAGISFKEEFLHIQPRLPDGWESISFEMAHRGNTFHFEIGTKYIDITVLEKSSPELPILVVNKTEYQLGQRLTIEYSTK
jgi:trehalose/maltose hydrolase-like predicted phosphorylase